MSETAAENSRYPWHFFRAGGFDQVRLTCGEDIGSLDLLDQKLWVALACPTRGLEFDTKTLDLVDTDKDGRIRAPEIIAAGKWTVAMLKNPDELLQSPAALPLASINDATVEGQALRASAKQILVNLGKPDAATISVDDTTDTVKIFAQTRFNGDGIIPADAADDAATQAVIADIISCMGGEPDRSGKLGINSAKLDLFFAGAEAYVGWRAKSNRDASLLPLGANTKAAADAVRAVEPKIEDYFARCRLTSFDPRAAAAVNKAVEEYVVVAAKELSLAGTELAAFPLARVEASRPLPLDESVNPGWRVAMQTFNSQVVKPLLGDKTSLTETEWATIVAKFAPFDAWLAAKTGGTVEKLGDARAQEILAGPYKKTITELLEKDQALESEANTIASVDRLVRYYRDLFKLLNNFVSFRDFYRRKDKAIFQAGTLYLDQRSCDLCVRVEDAGRHGLMAHLSRSYLAYCDLTRKATGEKMTIAAAFTDGDSENLMVGRNGIFYDRQGHDWDATITKIIDNPISIRQAFWLPYKRVIRWVEEIIAKRAAAADAASEARLQTAAANTSAALEAGKLPPVVPPPPAKKMDIGVVAALGVAVGAITGALGIFMQWLTGTPFYYLPLYFLLLILLISLPSMVIAWLKLRQRNLGPILDANGWAVNARAKMNIPFGRSLTGIPRIPAGSKRDLVDPFAENHTVRNRLIALAIVLVVLLAAGAGAWYFGCIEYYMPGLMQKSGYVERKEQAATQRAHEAAVKAATDKAAAEKPTTLSAPD